MGDAGRGVAKRLGDVSALIVASWCLKKLIAKSNSAPAQRRRAGPNIYRAETHRLIPKPESQLSPATPTWIDSYREPQNGEIPQPEHIIRALRNIARRAENMQLGEESLRVALFMLKKDIAEHYLNAGSYGGAYRLAGDAQVWYQKLLEAEPCHFNVEIAPKALQLAKRRLADFVRADAADVVHMTNATTAVNTVLFSTHLNHGDLLLITSITYPAVKNAVSRFATRAGASLVEVSLDLQTLLQGNGAIVDRFCSTLAQYGTRIKLAILDHITSSPTVRLPIRAIANCCRHHGVKVLVDGAHAVGAIDLNVPALGVQFYTSNLHKWGCCPKSAAFLWVEPGMQASMIPLVTSHGYQTGFQGEFAWQGTSDISAWLAVPIALRVTQALGFRRLREHNNQKLVKAVQMLLQAWGNDLLVLGVDAADSHMASIELPALRNYLCTSKNSEPLHSYLLKSKKIEVPINYWEGRLWVRISAQIYNTEADYRALRDAISELKC